MIKIDTFTTNYRKLYNSQKKGAGTPAYTRFVNRWLGRLLASFLASFKISPNSVSLLSGIITFISFIMFLVIDEIKFANSLILVFFLYFAYALDSADGQLARLLNRQSKQGEWLDHTLDAIKIPLSHGVAIFFIYKHKAINVEWIIFYIIILSFASAIFLSGILKSKLISKNEFLRDENNEKNSIVRSFLTLPLDFGILISLFLFSFNPNWFIIIYSIWGLIFIFYSILLLIKYWRELTINN